MTQHRKTTQAQLELWLIDPTTRNYLHALWASRDMHVMTQGFGDCVDFDSMEKTFAMTVRNEGTKEGYSSAMDVVGELLRHDLLIQESEIELPIMDESILDKVEEVI